MDESTATLVHPDPALTPRERRSWVSDVLRAAALAAFLAGALWVVRAMPLGGQDTAETIGLVREWLADLGLFAPLLFVLAGAALVAVGFPRLLLSAVAGALFQLAWGTLWALLASLAGATGTLLFCRLLGRDLVGRRLGHRLRGLDALAARNTFPFVLLLRLCPVGNNFVANCVLGVSSIRLGPFLAASFLGFLPETFTFALLGSGLVGNFALRTGLSAGLFVAFTAFFAWYYRRALLPNRVFHLLRKER